MGVPLKDIVVKHPITFEDLKGKKLAFDSNNILYQFLSAIRQRDGTPLKDSHGNITSHLLGLFNRTTKILEYGIKPCFVFDGKPLELKAATSAKRHDIRTQAAERYKKALAAGDHVLARKYAQQATFLTRDMIKETKELLDAMGLPCVQALSDAEAQAAHLAKRGMVWAVASQDYDALLFGTPRLIRNLTIAGRRKVPGKATTVSVRPEIINLTEVLNYHKIDIRGLVRAALLIGTDFNPGIKGIGPKTAIKVAQEGEFEERAKNMPVREQLEKIFLKPALVTGVNLRWKAPNPKKIREILVERHDFSGERINSAIKRIQDSYKKGQQRGLGDF